MGEPQGCLLKGSSQNGNTAKSADLTFWKRKVCRDREVSGGQEMRRGLTVKGSRADTEECRDLPGMDPSKPIGLHAKQGELHGVSAKNEKYLHFKQRTG